MARPTKCIIDLKKLENNFLNIKNFTKKKVLVLVKANAYGHGIVECSRVLEKAGVDYLGTASLEEGVKLRESGIKCPILCVGALPQDSENMCVDFNVDQAISSVEELCRIEEYSSQKNIKAKVHIKIETGMHRTGIRSGNELDELLKRIKKSEYVTLKGVFTHFAVSDSDDRTYTDYQAEEFKKAVAQIKNEGFDVIVHCANSGAILQYPELTFDMVRSGIISYGYYPSEETQKTIKIEPILSFVTKVVAVNKVLKGECISYGCTYKAEKNMLIAVLPVGYGDGYKRIMSNRGYVLIDGKKANITGRICMDMTMVDVTDIPSVKVGDDVVLIGTQGEEVISADNLAKWAETINYEIMLSITERVPKEYV